MRARKNFARRKLASALTLFVLFAAQVSPRPAHTQAARERGPRDTKELEALLDPVFAEQMSKLRIPGAAVAVVRDGRIVFTKGYGFANLERKTPVVPNRTIFRIGSITKVFTATAVVQLSERGRIRLDDDVNRHLKELKVPDTYPRPVTFDNLLTHTGGLDEINLGRRAQSADRVLPLAQFLKTRLRRRLPPGEIISYSTYGITLAGHLVETISGLHLGEYFSRNIFKPLGMSRSSLGVPPPAQMPDLATGYEHTQDGYQQSPFEYFHTYPASDINSTATDMARFMIAHLQEGRHERARILSARSARDMRRQHFTNHPRLPGWAYGFYESPDNNLRGVEHGGSMEGFSNLMYLLPDEGVGLYVACNNEAGGPGLAGAVKTKFLNHYFPYRGGPQSPTTTQPRERLERFAGKYRWDVYCHTCPPDARGFFPQAFEVKVNDDGTLSFWGGRWAQVEPLLFRLVRDRTDARELLVAFREGSDGRITYLLNGANANEKAPPESP